MEQEKLLRIKQVEELTGLKRSCIYVKIKNGDFPRQYELGTRTVAWKATEIQNWINSKLHVTTEKEQIA